MAQTKIEWTATPRADGTLAPGYTFNPWMGCTKVSAGCANCYAEALIDKHYKKAQWGPDGTRVRTTPEYWRQPVKWNRAAAAAGERRKVFCASLADVFEERAELDAWRRDLWALIDATPSLDWLLLTKRPENIETLAPINWINRGAPHNVWLGTSVENQETANERIPLLLRYLPVVRFLSCEPLLGPLNFVGRDHPCGYYFQAHMSMGQSPIDWIIVGGESGRHARPCSLDWMRDLRDQCAATGVPCFVKQLGANVRLMDGDTGVYVCDDDKGGDPIEWPADLRVRQWPSTAVIAANQAWQAETAK